MRSAAIQREYICIFTMTSQWAPWCLKSPASRLFTKPYVPMHIEKRKKKSKLRVNGLCEGNPPVSDGFPSQGASNSENHVPFDDVIIWNAQVVLTSLTCLKITKLKLQVHLLGSNKLTHCGRDKMAALLQTTVWYLFCWMRIDVYWVLIGSS